MLYQSPFLQLLQQLPPAYVVCIHNNKTLTVAELIEQSKNLAANLSAKGIKKGDHVLLACDVGIEFLILFMALIHLRTKTALVDPHMGNQRYASKLQQFQPKWAFIDSRLLLLQEHPVIRFIYRRKKPGAFYIPYSNSYTIFATGMWLPLMQKHHRLKFTANASADIIPSKEDDELLVVYTSGTLAEPKAVVHTMNSLYESLKAVAALFDENKQASMVTHLPQFALIGMMTGYKTFFWKETTPPDQRIEFIKQHQITTLFGPPAEYRDLMSYCKKTNQLFPESLSHLILGSAPVLKSLLIELRQFSKAKITCLYGMTEHLVVSSIDADEKIKYAGKGDILGLPLKGMQYKITDDGELLIQSPLLFKRYFHLQEADEFHATGDLVATDPMGRLIMKGRKKNMIIRANKNIYPGLYETTIAQIKGVKDVCMIGLYDEGIHDEHVILVVDADNTLTEKALLQELKNGKHAIDSDALPDHIIFQSIPKSGRQQKTDQQTLLEQIKQQLPSLTTLS
ncbi:class I adenylate-forming enzyme family protein [Lacibacter sediminis]|uniref:Acyl--CoA ligase n=1 Tax=Lacibacter sediminis TaxID=2760713 RepID=A0A7G5XDS7_9BACT|nr:class I adenylate-forming enzyme family protein [Lacibacter sediminis]QNA43630.1 acyl--CoA ligase [Lacibacter sediminis]